MKLFIKYNQLFSNRNHFLIYFVDFKIYDKILENKNALFSFLILYFNKILNIFLRILLSY